MFQVNDLRKELTACGFFMIENGLTWGNSGNVSARIGVDKYLISASGTELGALSGDDFVICSFSKEEPYTGQYKPSKERPMHQAVYEVRPDINAVLHASPFYSTMIACSDIDIPSSLFVESMYYLERIEKVPYHHPGSTDLGEAVRSKATMSNILILENHGVLVYDTSIAEAKMALHTLEMTCRMLILAQSANLRLQGLSSEKAIDFLNHSGYKPKRTWFT